MCSSQLECEVGKVSEQRRVVMVLEKMQKYARELNEVYVGCQTNLQTWGLC